MQLCIQPIAARLWMWWHETGDSAEQIATGFDLPEANVRAILTGDTEAIGEAAAARLCRQLRLDPNEIWPGVPRNETLQWEPSIGGYEPWPSPHELIDA